jgi:tRNA-2-methylthio-N6-dimethylallyladenosine synthase
VSRRYYLRTFGCQMNEHDSERIAGLLEADGLERADSVEAADVVVLNTCCIRENADNRLYGHLGHLKAEKARRPDLQIVVGGCLAQKDRDLIRERAPQVDVVFGTHNVHRAAELLAEARSGGPVVEILEETVAEDAEAFPSALPVRREVAHAAWVTIQIGCDNHCAFCIVPSVRGVEMSRPFADVVDEVTDLVDDGVIEVTLLGQNVNSYGRDLTSRLRVEAPSASDRELAGARWADDHRRRPRALFADLLGAVGAVPGLRRIRYTSPHPKDFRADVAVAMAETDAVCEHLHLPLQSGSDRVLAEMHRGYTAERYLQRLAEARDNVDDLAVTTDIIVGFPGETDADFERTLEVAATAGYDGAYTFVYSPRAGTEAAERVDRFVAEDVVRARFDRLRGVIDRSSRLRHEARVGRVETALVEGPSRRDRSAFTARTRQNKIVHVSHGDHPPPGSLVDVRVLRAGTHSLRGELVELLAAPPRRRRRIPVVAV